MLPPGPDPLSGFGRVGPLFMIRWFVWARSPMSSSRSIVLSGICTLFCAWAGNCQRAWVVSTESARVRRANTFIAGTPSRELCGKLRQYNKLSQSLQLSRQFASRPRIRRHEPGNASVHALGVHVPPVLHLGIVVCD